MLAAHAILAVGQHFKVLAALVGQLARQMRLVGLLGEGK